MLNAIDAELDYRQNIQLDHWGVHCHFKQLNSTITDLKMDHYTIRIKGYYNCVTPQSINILNQYQ